MNLSLLFLPRSCNCSYYWFVLWGIFLQQSMKHTPARRDTHTHAHVFLHDKFLSSQNGVILCAEPSSACYVPVSDLGFGLHSQLHSHRSFIFNSVISCTACITFLTSVQRGKKASQRKSSNLACISWFLSNVGSYISYTVYSFLQFNTVVNFQLT